MPSHNQSLILVDAHVHLRDCFNVERFLERAAANFKQAAHTADKKSEFVGALLFTDSGQEDGFGRLRSHLTQHEPVDAKERERWCLRNTVEDTSLYITRKGEDELCVIAGRQLLSKEQLEVLAIGTRRPFNGQRSAKSLIRSISEAGALPIVPWGVGKWLGRRGAIVEDLLRDPRLPPFYLGDSANRPVFWPQSSLFRRAEERGICNLPGSDPLPLPAECQRPGSFGFTMNGTLSAEQPTHDLLQKVSDPSNEVRPYGRGDGLFSFLRNQIAMQYRKRFNNDHKA